MNNYKKLLNKFNNLNTENENKKKLGIHDYSLINALLNINREVELHSNFIYSMINPNSTHYCGYVFLHLFLESINKSNFITLANAKVHREKGKIDLLIEDGKKILIIENKLKAPDQKHQISRYIEYIIKTYLHGDSNSLENKIHIVYLSEYKKIPNEKKDSTIGFQKLNYNSTELIWNNKKVDLNNGTSLNLVNNTKLKFNRVQHSQHLLKWVKLSKEWLKAFKPKEISSGLSYAFDEYELILKRLDTQKGWKNLMTLNEYTLTLKENEQEKMYKFMCDANNRLNDFLGEKLFIEIDKLFNKKNRKKLVLNKNFKDFNKNSCIKWFNQKNNNYMDIGFEIKINNTKYVFALGKNNISYGKYINSKFEWVKNIQTNRKNIQTNKGKNLFDIINDIKRYKEY